MSNSSFKSVKEIAMYFHSSFRNVGLYTSLSFAGLAAAKSYLSTNLLYYLLLTIISVTLLIVSFLLNYFLFIRIYNLSSKFVGLNTWLITSGIMFILQIILLIFGSVLLYNHYNTNIKNKIFLHL